MPWGNDSGLILLYFIWLLASAGKAPPPTFSQARVFQSSAPRYVQISPRFFQIFSTTETELIASLITFPKMVPKGASPVDFLSPLVEKQY